MAARIVSHKGSRMLMVSKQRVVAYLPSLSSVVRHFRAFSSYDEQNPSDDFPKVVKEAIDNNLGPFGAQDKRFPMPGLVGPAPSVQSKTKISSQQDSGTSDLFSEPLAQERHQTVFETYMTVTKELEARKEAQFMPQEPSAFDVLECVAQNCPQLIKKDFQDLFPGHDIMKDPMTVITLSHKTEHDMSLWNQEVEEEREQLLEKFIAGASEICEALHEAGYWADFIDPSSGRPYLGPYTNATLFETDERYRHFGFDIEDLGCCKVISHHLWGTSAYVGCLFTNAPLDHPVLQQMTVAD